jgi:hypothetical protein
MSEAEQDTQHNTLVHAHPHHSFKLNNTSIELHNLQELADALDIMTQETFSHHVSETKNDFAVWLHDILGETELSQQIRGVQDKQKMAEIVKTRLTRIHAPEKPPRKTLSAKVIFEFLAGVIVGLVVGYFIFITFFA